MRVKIYFTLHELSTMEHFTWYCYVDDSDKIRYDIIFSVEIY